MQAVNYYTPKTHSESKHIAIYRALAADGYRIAPARIGGARLARVISKVQALHAS